MIGLRSTSRRFLMKISASEYASVIVAHLFGITRKKDNVVKTPGYLAELMHLAFSRNSLIAGNVRLGAAR